MPKPVIIEIMGMPNAGKTGAMKALIARIGPCAALYEAAVRCPIEHKFSPAFNEWTFSETMRRVLESLDSGDELIVCERGFVDTLCWMRAYFNDGLISRVQYDAVAQYIVNCTAFAALRLVIAFTCEPSVALAREGPRASPGQIVNLPILSKYGRALDEVLREHGGLLTDYTVLNTTHQSPEETAQVLMAIIAERI